MNKSQGINNFWNQFGWNAYDESIIPENASLPYITYSVTIDNLDNPVSMQANLWDKSSSWKRVSDKADAIGKKLDESTPIKIDGGYIYIVRGKPFANRIADTDEMIRRININVMVEYLTEH